MQLLTDYETVLHIREIAASEPFESELKMLSGGVSFFSALRLHKYHLCAPTLAASCSAPLSWGAFIDFSKTFMPFLQLAGVPF